MKKEIELLTEARRNMDHAAGSKNVLKRIEMHWNVFKCIENDNVSSSNNIIMIYDEVNVSYVFSSFLTLTLPRTIC